MFGLSSCQHEDPATQPVYELQWWEGRPVVVQQALEGLVTVSAASTTGIFLFTERCLTVAIDGREWSPILPANAILAGERKAIGLGQFLATFGTEYGLENIALNIPVPEEVASQIRGHGCPTNFAYLSGIEAVARPNVPSQ